MNAGFSIEEIADVSTLGQCPVNVAILEADYVVQIECCKLLFNPRQGPNLYIHDLLFHLGVQYTDTNAG